MTAMSAKNPNGKLLVPHVGGAEPYPTDALEVAVPGALGITCAAGHSFPRPRTVARDGFDTCTCGQPPGPSIAVLRDDAWLVEDVNAAGTRQWWHASTQSALTLSGRQFVHLGSREAAADRANYLLHRAVHSGRTIEVFLYSTRLRPDARVHLDVLVEEPMAGSDHTHAESLLSGADAVRYVNATEAPGSVSLVARAEALEPLTAHGVMSS
ncbi:hypothetical protein [Microbacterium stercoris]|uniref:Uncharacterized protein n=1 Tax=Microbacterium stercoris TaxID=2820289 RepID=A0A939QRR0_9MICO|nr:hypothetical protein [Microbacterium stercoris]MBO3663878.1 hypothetical protein [Microbacterium stercoris]